MWNYAIFPFEEVRAEVGSTSIGFSACVVEDKLYRFGGFDVNGIQNTLFWHKSGAKTPFFETVRSCGASVPVPRHGHAMESYKKGFVIHGGIGKGKSILSDVWSYDIETCQWKELASPTAPHAPSAVFHTANIIDNCNLFVFGMDGFHLFDLTTCQWQTLQYNVELTRPGIPSARLGHVSGVWRRKLFVFGGIVNGQLSEELWCFDVASGTWQEVQHRDPENGESRMDPGSRAWCKATVIGNSWLLVGGLTSTGQYSSDLWEFDFCSLKWSRAPLLFFQSQQLTCPQRSADKLQNVTVDSSELSVTNRPNALCKPSLVFTVYDACQDTRQFRSRSALSRYNSLPSATTECSALHSGALHSGAATAMHNTAYSTSSTDSALRGSPLVTRAAAGEVRRRASCDADATGNHIMMSSCGDDRNNVLQLSAASRSIDYHTHMQRTVGCWDASEVRSVFTSSKSLVTAFHHLSSMLVPASRQPLRRLRSPPFTVCCAKHAAADFYGTATRGASNDDTTDIAQRDSAEAAARGDSAEAAARGDSAEAAARGDSAEAAARGDSAEAAARGDSAEAAARGDMVQLCPATFENLHFRPHGLLLVPEKHQLYLLGGSSSDCTLIQQFSVFHRNTAVIWQWLMTSKRIHLCHIAFQILSFI